MDRRLPWDELVENLHSRFDLEVEELPLLALGRRRAAWVEPPALSRPVGGDPDDDGVLATTVAGQPELVVTGGLNLLIRRGARIAYAFWLAFVAA